MTTNNHSLSQCSSCLVPSEDCILSVNLTFSSSRRSLMIRKKRFSRKVSLTFSILPFSTFLTLLLLLSHLLSKWSLVLIIHNICILYIYICIIYIYVLYIYIYIIPIGRAAIRATVGLVKTVRAYMYIYMYIYIYIYAYR